MKQTGRVILTLVLALVMALPHGPLWVSSPQVAEASPQRAAEPAPLAGPGLTEPSVDIRVNAGGASYVDGQGKTWLADQPYAPGSWGYAGGSAYAMTPPLDIFGTTEDALYQTQRSNPLQYRFDVPNDTYEVELRFAEIYCTSDCRSFGIKIEGTTVITGFAPFRVAYRTAVNLTYVAQVTDNQLNIEFVNVKSTAIVNALRVTGSDPASPRTTFRINAAGYDHRDVTGRIWFADKPYTQGTYGYLGTTSSPFKTTNAIANTEDDPLFQTNRYLMTDYVFDVPNGPYRVDLLLAEIYASVNAPGVRVFDVDAEGIRKLTGVDVFALAGNRDRAITQTFTINVLDGQLNISFIARGAPIQPPIVNALRVSPLDTDLPGSWSNFTPSGFVTTQTPTVTVQVSDGQSGLAVASGQYAYSTDGGASWSAWLPAPTTGTEGTTTPQTMTAAAVPFNQDSATLNRIKFRISDVGGNIGESPVYTVQVDTTRPSSTITVPPPGGAVPGGTFIIQGTASDAASGVQRVDVSTDGGASWHPATGTTSWSYTWNIPGDGIYNLRSRATDNVGLVETPGSGNTVTVDSTPPVTFISRPTSGQWITGTVAITGTAFDATSGIRRVEVSTDNGSTWVTATGTTSWSYMWTPTSDGARPLRARAVDNAGNTDTPGAAVNVNVDVTPPTTTFADPTAGGAIRGTSYTISGHASDPAPGLGLSAVELSLDGGTTWNPVTGLADWYYTWNPLPADGTYTLQARARDLLGNLQNPPTSITITVDNVPPVTAGAASGLIGNNGWFISPVTVTLNATDDRSPIRHTLYRLDAGSWMTYTVPFVVSNSGNHTVQFYSVDLAGNAESPASLSFRLDIINPSTVASLSGTAGEAGWFRSNVGVSLSAIDGQAGVHMTRYRLDGGGWLGYTAPFTVSGDASHSLEYYSIDLAGNIEPTHTQAVRIDTVAPSTTATPSGTVGDGGWYRSPVVITLARSDATAGIKHTLYRIGSGAWLTYTAPFTVSTNGAQTLQYYSVDNAGNVEATRSLPLNVDTLAPTTTASPSGVLGDGGWYRTAVAVALTANDNASGVRQILYRVDGGAWTTYGVPFTVGTDGSHTVNYYSIDNAGNVEVTRTLAVNIDTVEPTTTRAVAGVEGNSGWYRSVVTVTLTGIDSPAGIRAVYYRLDSGSWQTYTLPIVISDDGSHSLEYYAVDNAGNAEGTHLFSVGVDKAAPVTAASLAGTLGDNGWYRSPVTVTLVATDTTSTVRDTFYRLDAGPWLAYVSPFIVAANGSHTLEYYSVDVAGNTEVTRSETLLVDTTTPSTLGSLSGSAGTGGWYRSAVVFTLTALDGTSGIRDRFYRIDAGPWQSYSAPVPISTNGQYIIEYYSVDNAGNVEATHSLTAKIDTVDPTSTATVVGMMGEGGWYRSPVGISLAAADSTSGVHEILYRLNGGSWTSYTNALVVAAEGAHTLVYYAVDNAGNDEDIHMLTFYIDTQLPTSSVTAPAADQAINGSTFLVQGTAGDSGSGVARVEVSIDAGPWVLASGTTSWSYLWSLPASGSHTVRSRAIDAAGNAETPGPGIYVMVDNTRPSSTFEAPYDGQVLVGAIYIISGSAVDTYSGVAGVDISTDGGATWSPATMLSPVTWDYTWILPADGTYNLRSRATDRAGNVETVGAGITVQIDRSVPQSSIADPLEGQYIRGATYTIMGTASDSGSGVKRVEVSIDDGPWVAASGLSNWSYVWTLPLNDDGPHTVRSRAIDNAGNVETPGQSITVIVDNGRPTSRILSPVEGQIVTQPIVTISGTSSDTTSAVKRVEISIRRAIDGYYWDGSNWTSAETWLSTLGPVTDWGYAWVGSPTVAMITVRSRATDNVGNVEIPSVGVTFSIQRGVRVVLPIIMNDMYQ